MPIGKTLFMMYNKYIKSKEEIKMLLRKYTQAEFDAIPRDRKGRKICPPGDYTSIKFFPEKTCFGPYSKFAENSKFERFCHVGPGSVFGKNCQFAMLFRSGDDCIFNEGCSIGSWSKFGARTRMRVGCSVGSHSEFKEECCFG